jgi:regulator of sirC expression with transglutaminase-like and TPR domain
MLQRLKISIFCLAQCYVLATATQEDLKLRALYSSIDPLSISELFAFYELYPESTYSQQAFAKVWQLLNLHKTQKISLIEQLFLPKLDISSLVSLVNKQPYETPTPLTHEQLFMIERLASHLHNRTLEGYNAKTKEQIQQLPSDQIDIARALLIYQYDNQPDAHLMIRRYEAQLDMMALQILARLPLKSSNEQILEGLSDFIFHKMQFRFPPQSLMVKEVDTYTLLPSVLDNRKGVCLGVSILYLSLAQRLNLPLEIITPPGHIYVRYHQGSTLINIETTARGVHMPTEIYLGINTYQLSTRSMKEVVGMAFVNQASVLWGKGQYAQAAQLYENALPFMPDDYHLKLFLAIQYLLLSEKKQARALLDSLLDRIPQDCVYKDTLAEDILALDVDKDSLEAVFSHVDETRESILKKQASLKKVVEKYPKFRAGLLHYAITFLQLGRSKEALDILQKYARYDHLDPTVNYYLSILFLERLCYKESLVYLKKTQQMLETKNHKPKCLKDLQAHLQQLYCETAHTDCK